MLTLLLALTCGGSDLAANFAQGQAIVADALAAEAERSRVQEKLAFDEQQLRAERSNPSGIVNLRTMHDLGEYILEERATLVELSKREREDAVWVRRLIVQADAIVASCKRRDAKR